MNKRNFKCFFSLFLMIFLSEILNVIVYLLFNFLIIPNLVSKMMSGNEIDILSHLAVAIFDLIVYFFIGKKIFARIDSKKDRQNIMFALAVVIVLFYPIIKFGLQSDLFVAIYWELFSPVAYVLLLPVLLYGNNIVLFYEILYVLLSPISVVLIWLFSKIGSRKKLKHSVDE